jgi:hypothetical protein
MLTLLIAAMSLQMPSATLRVGRRGAANHERTETRLRALSARQIIPNERVAQLWRRLRGSAMCSLVLWTATLVAGALLVNVA